MSAAGFTAHLWLEALKVKNVSDRGEFAMLHRFTAPTTNFSLFLIDKVAPHLPALDETHAPVPIWRSPQPCPHTHQEHEINLVVEGAARYRVWDAHDGEQEFEVTAGRALVICGGTTHIVEIESRAVVRGLWLHPSLLQGLELNQAAERLRDFQNPLPARLCGDAALFAASIEVFGLASSEYARPSALHNEALRALGSYSALLLVRMFESRALTSDDPASRRVAQTAAWLERHFLEEVALPDLARRAGLSPSRFAALFRAQAGCNPKEWILEKRFQHAKTLLVAGHLPLSQVAWSCGFAHEASFNRFFKARAGVAPGQFRRDGVETEEKTKNSC